MLAVPFFLLLVLLLFVRVILVQLVLGPGVHFLRQEGFQSEPKENVVGFFFVLLSINDVFLGETVAFALRIHVKSFTMNQVLSGDRPTLQGKK